MASSCPDTLDDWPEGTCGTCRAFFGEQIDLRDLDRDVHLSVRVEEIPLISVRECDLVFGRNIERSFTKEETSTGKEPEANVWKY